MNTNNSDRAVLLERHYDLPLPELLLGLWPEHPSYRKMASALSQTTPVSPSTIHYWLRELGLRPHTSASYTLVPNPRIAGRRRKAKEAQP